MTRDPENQESSTQDRIRQAAIELFATWGYAGTSISDIAQEAGISKAGLYNYYTSKGELLLQLLEQSFKAWVAASRHKLRDPGSCHDRLWEHFRSAIQFAREHPAEVAVIRVAATQIDGEVGVPVQAMVTAQKEDYLEDLETFFAEALERKEVQDAKPSDLARSWRAFLDGLLTDLVFRKQDLTPSEERLQGMWEILWRGLQGAPAARK